MKFAFIGSHGVGKTTLCFDLAARLKRFDISVDIVKEVARDCPLPINQNTSPEAQAWILHTQCAREIAAAARFQAIICDRAVIDNYAYYVYRAGRTALFDGFVREWCKSYDGLVRVPIWREPRFDGVRDTDLMFQREIDQLVSRLLGEFGFSCLELRPEEIEEWCDQVLGYLGLDSRPLQLPLFADERERETIPDLE